MPLQDFETAAAAWQMDYDDLIEEHDKDPWQVISTGIRHHDPHEDPCDPVTVTRVVQMTDAGFARVLASAMIDARNGYPDMSVEQAAIGALRDVYQPTPCHCSYDCCGHRNGWAEVQHIGGALFIVQTHTSRNY